jgi:hypothetical protein
MQQAQPGLQVVDPRLISQMQQAQPGQQVVDPRLISQMLQAQPGQQVAMTTNGPVVVYSGQISPRGNQQLSAQQHYVDRHGQLVVQQNLGQPTVMQGVDPRSIPQNIGMQQPAMQFISRQTGDPKQPPKLKKTSNSWFPRF